MTNHSGAMMMGALSAFSIFPSESTRLKFSTRPSFFKNDAAALSADLQLVADDMKISVYEYTVQK